MFRNSIFNKINISRTFATNGKFYDIAFSQKELDKEALNALDTKIINLQENINQSEKKLKMKQEQLYIYKQNKKELTEPFHHSELANSALNEMTIIITNGIYQSILNGKTEIKHGPSFGYSVKLLQFIEPILAQYGLSYEISSITKHGEAMDYLQIKFPEMLNNTTRFFTQIIQNIMIG